MGLGKVTKPKPTDIQSNLDNRGKTLKGCEHNTYDSEPDPMPVFGLAILGIDDRGEAAY